MTSVLPAGESVAGAAEGSAAGVSAGIDGALTLVDRLPVLTPATRLFFMTGFLGALTTFSTYALEVVESLRGGGFLVAALTFVANNIGGIALVLAGMWLVQILFKGGAPWP